jgi:hypothetical protein
MRSHSHRGKGRRGHRVRENWEDETASGRLAWGKGPADAKHNQLKKKKMENMKMKKVVITMMAAALVAGVASAADVSVGVDFASAYVFRGVTLNDGFVAQPWAEISGLPIDEKFGSFAFGIWGNYDIDEVAPGSGSGMSELDYYISYALPVSVVDMGVTYTEYTYSGAGIKSDKEVAMSVGKALGESGLYSSVTANYGVGGAVNKILYVSAGLDYEKSLSDKLSLSSGIAAGYVVADKGEDGFNDATASLGLGYALNDTWSVGASVTYIAQLDDKVLVDAAYDVDFVGALSLGCDF